MLNQANIIGHLGNDPDVKYNQAGEAITSISVATTEKWKDKSGQQQERTEWHRVTFFGRLAEIAGEYLHKGKLVYISGRIQTDKYTDKDGIERYATKIVANEMKMLGGRDDAGGGGQQRQAAPQRTQQPAQQRGGGSSRAPTGQPARQAPRQQQAPLDDGFSEDEIPFD